MSLTEMSSKVKEFLSELLGKYAEIISITPNCEGWTVKAELLMDEEYTMSRGRNDLLHVFVISLDSNQNIISYDRIGIRERGRIEE
jgi:hypothetical protein